MDCERTALEIQSWIDGELAPERELELKRHLEHCSSCRSLADRIEGVGEMVRRVPGPVPSESLDERVMASFLSSRASAAASVPVARPRGLWLSRPAITFVAAVVFVFGLTAFYLGWTLGQRQYEKTTLPINQSTRAERTELSQSRAAATDPRSQNRVRGVDANGQASGTPLSLTGFRPILEPQIRIIGRQAQ